MNQKPHLIILVLGILFLVPSCDRHPCVNKNKLFDAYEINSLEYKTELMRQMEKIGSNNLRYWFENYFMENEKEYLIVNIQNDSLCAKGVLLVTNWNKIEGIKLNKGIAYHGAELEGLTFDIRKDSNTIEFIYKDVKRIVD